MHMYTIVMARAPGHEVKGVLILCVCDTHHNTVECLFITVLVPLPKAKLSRSCGEPSSEAVVSLDVLLLICPLAWGGGGGDSVAPKVESRSLSLSLSRLLLAVISHSWTCC